MEKRLVDMAMEHNRLVDLWHCQGVDGYWFLSQQINRLVKELRDSGDDSACLCISCMDYPKICGISVNHSHIRIPMYTNV